jgi:HAD superfamily hydrolase (TIGR01509 family)
MQQCGCVIFDCDGTLVESEVLQCELLGEQLREFTVSVPVDELLMAYRGWNLAGIVSALAHKHSLELDADFIDKFRRLELSAISSRLTAVDGVRVALSDIQVPMCVASNGPRFKIRHALTATGLDRFFADGNLFSADDINKWKPAPDLFWYAADSMGVASHECVVVEDSAIGVQAAISAGMRVIHYLGSANRAAEPGAFPLQHMGGLSQALQEVREATWAH